MAVRQKAPENPWGLTHAQILAMDAMVEHGCHKLAAIALNRSVKTVEYHCQAAGERINARTMLLKYLTYDRWRRGVEK